jgi:hypothetical protein
MIMELYTGLTIMAATFLTLGLGWKVYYNMYEKES